jgi:hypothetical protein
MGKKLVSAPQASASTSPLNSLSTKLIEISNGFSQNVIDNRQQQPEGRYVTEEIFDNQLRPFFLKKYHPPNRELIYTRNG